MTEYFDIIDENDKIIGKASRDECHKKGLLHRAVHIMIINSKGKMLLQKRSMKKDLYKGWWIDAAAGHVDSGESYEGTAKREMMEELGIDVNIEELFRVRKKYASNSYVDNEIVTVYLGKSNGPFKFDKNEVDFVKFFPPKKVLEMLKTEKFTPVTVVIFEELEKHPAILKKLGLS